MVGRRLPLRLTLRIASKTVPAPYNAANSGGSNLGPTNKALIERVQGDVEKAASRRTPPLPSQSIW